MPPGGKGLFLAKQLVEGVAEEQVSSRELPVERDRALGMPHRLIEASALKCDRREPEGRSRQSWIGGQGGSELLACSGQVTLAQELLSLIDQPLGLLSRGAEGGRGDVAPSALSAGRAGRGTLRAY